MASPSIDDQVELLMQGTEYGDESLKQVMSDELGQRLVESGRERRPLRVYCGFDPRTSDLHVGHFVPIRKMRQFQELGHEVIFLIGRFTSLVGDPSDKDKVRAQISFEEVMANAETYAEQAFKILDRDRTRVEYNDTWLAKLTFKDLIHLASNFTVQQFLGRESFRKRFEKQDPIYIHEFFYAIMQAFDAYYLKTDVQIGGSDQLFNIITAGRKLMEAMGARPNIGIILGILPGTDGVIKMSKSLGNHIPLNTTAEDMYGKVMSVPDEAMGDFFRLVTRWTPKRIQEIEFEMRTGKAHPRDVKMQLAREIVSIFHGDRAAEDAEGSFRTVFQDGRQPEEMPSFQLRAGMRLIDVMVEAGTVKSKSEARRHVEQGAVRLEGAAMEDPNAELEITSPVVLRVGKRRFRRLLPPDGP